jgi:multidrug transporter EmrE-like cation transporter
MAAFRLCAGVIWVALVSRYVLGETLTTRKLIGFGVMLAAMVLIGSKRRLEERASIPGGD